MTEGTATKAAALRRLRVAAATLGVLVLVMAIAAVPLSRLAHQSFNAWLAGGDR